MNQLSRPKLHIRVIFAWFSLTLLSVSFIICPAHACTLWAAIGRSTGHQATLIAKNRDWSPDQYQELRFMAPAGGFKFLVLHPRGAVKPRDIAGVNEKGLVLVTAAASCIPRRERPESYYLEGFLNGLLASCATVDEVIKKQGILSSPAFYLVADPAKIALIEVGLNGKRSIKVMDNEVLAHTNHYLDKNLADSNRKFNRGSYLRLFRIRYLLKSQGRPLTLEDFIRFSQDRYDGPDHSILRKGSSPRQVHTLSTWIVSLPMGDSPRLYVRLRDPEGHEKVHLLKLDASFWAKRAPGALDLGKMGSGAR